MSLEAFEAAGLFDPAAPRAAERQELLEHLVERFGVEAVIQAAERTPLFAVAVELTDPQSPRLSSREAAAATGLELEEIRLLRAAVGSPVQDDDEPSLPSSIVEDAAAYAVAVELFGREATLAFIRVLARVSQQVADAARALFATSVREEAGLETVTEVELSRANEVAWAAYGSIPSVLGHLLVERTDSRQDLVARIVEGDLRVAVAFVDLVGSTEWTAEIEPGRHGAALARFEQAAWETAIGHDGRLVKLIGDEAMIVADAVDAACRIALELCACAAADPDLPPARGAVGFGEVTTRGGDYFGPVVNLVARAVDEAPPGAVVVTDGADAHLLDDWSLQPLPAVSLRGVPAPVPLAVVRRVTA